MNTHLKQALPPLLIIGGIAGLFLFMNSNTSAPAIEHVPTVEKNDEGRTIMLHTSNWKFSPNTIRLKKGENVSLHLMGIQGNHGLAIPGLGINEVMAKGSMNMVKVPTDKTGTFDFYCNISCGAGHADMQGTIIIE